MTEGKWLLLNSADGMFGHLSPRRGCTIHSLQRHTGPESPVGPLFRARPSISALQPVRPTPATSTGLTDLFKEKPRGHMHALPPSQELGDSDSLMPQFVLLGEASFHQARVQQRSFKNPRTNGLKLPTEGKDRKAPRHKWSPSPASSVALEPSPAWPLRKPRRPALAPHQQGQPTSG